MNSVHELFVKSSHCRGPITVTAAAAAAMVSPSPGLFPPFHTGVGIGYRQLSLHTARRAKDPAFQCRSHQVSHAATYLGDHRRVRLGTACFRDVALATHIDGHCVRIDASNPPRYSRRTELMSLSHVMKFAARMRWASHAWMNATCPRTPTCRNQSIPVSSPGRPWSTSLRMRRPKGALLRRRGVSCSLAGGPVC